MSSVLLFLFSVFIAAISQIMLKISAIKTHENLWNEYLNVKVMLAYGLFFCSSLLTIIAYRDVPLSFGPILEGTSYIYISVLGYYFLKETLSRKQIIGLILIISGIIICYIPF